MHKSHRHPTVLPGVDVISILSDRSFPRHSHDEFGFGYLVTGGQSSWSHRGMVEAQAGDVITVNPAEIHDGLGRKGQPRHWRMIFLTPAALSEFSDGPPDRAEFARPVKTCPAALAQTINAFKALASGVPDLNDAEQLLMLALADHLGKPGGDGPSEAAQRSRAVQIALDMIHQDWPAHLSLADFARATGTGRFQILRRFSKEVGSTPHAYLMQHRVKRAKDMILRGASLADTAFACGFSDQSHLTRSFSRQVGVTPGRFSRAAARPPAISFNPVSSGSPMLGKNQR